MSDSAWDRLDMVKRRGMSIEDDAAIFNAVARGRELEAKQKHLITTLKSFFRSASRGQLTPDHWSGLRYAAELAEADDAPSVQPGDTNAEASP